MRELHPVSAFCLLLLLLLLSAFSTEPLMICLSLCGGLTLCALLGNVKGQIKLCIAVISLFALTNPIFSHAGETVLFYINHNAVTLESVLYGATIGGMMAATLCWFAAFARILDTERMLYLFGRILPKTALLLSAGNRMIPLIGRRYTAVLEAEEAASLAGGDSFMEKLRFRARVLSVTMAVSLEGAVQTGQAMKARGYGLPGRKSFGLFRFTKGDGLFLSASVLLAGMTAFGVLTENLYFMGCFCILCALPSLREGREILRWR